MKYIIYKITIQNYIYIGSTKNFTRRKCNHKSACICKPSVLLYKTINELGGWENCIMIPIEEYECENNIQAHIREEQLRIEYNANLNMIKSFATDEDYIQKKKEYNEKNKEKLNKYNEEYRIKHKGTKKEYYKL